ncbi:MAG: DUF4190 domain-containing protein [bacterium]|nr:DUF4190 domain-containing protein [bacterium]
MDEAVTSSGVMPPEDKASGRAVTALVLGIVGMLCCGPLAIAAWILGAMELSDIKKGLSSKAGEGMAKAGMIIGIVGTVLMILGILIWISIMAIGIMAGVAESGSY